MPRLPTDPPRYPSAEERRDEQIAELRTLLLDVREMLIEVRRAQGDERAGTRCGRMDVDGEKWISLETAATIIFPAWEGRPKKDLESLVGVLRLWATTGAGGVILETNVKRKQWVTTREAVERFLSRAPIRRDR